MADRTLVETALLALLALSCAQKPKAADDDKTISTPPEPPKPTKSENGLVERPSPDEPPAERGGDGEVDDCRVAAERMTDQRRRQNSMASDPAAAVELTAAAMEAARTAGDENAELDARIERGHAYAIGGKLEKAIEDFEEAAWQAATLKRDVDMAAAASYLVALLHKAGKDDDARGWARHADAAFKRVGVVPEKAVLHRAMLQLSPDDEDHRAALTRQRVACGRVQMPFWFSAPVDTR